MLNLQGVGDMPQLVSFTASGSGLEAKVVSELSATAYCNRLQDWEKYKAPIAI